MSAETPAHILVVDDDERLRNLLRRFLSDQGFIVSEAQDAAAARDILRHISYDLVVLDVMMPGEDGLALTRSWKKEGIQTPVLLLTALGETTARIDGLEAGADDYLAKPFDPKELLLRIRAILRRTLAPEMTRKAIPEVFVFGGWTLDLDRGELENNGERISLTQTELTLLRALTSKPGEIISREELCLLCGLEANERTIDVQITRLRKKIGDDPKTPRYVQTVRGKGYILWPD